jgi:hypothetical protein
LISAPPFPAPRSLFLRQPFGTWEGCWQVRELEYASCEVLILIARRI